MPDYQNRKITNNFNENINITPIGGNASHFFDRVMKKKKFKINYLFVRIVHVTECEQSIFRIHTRIESGRVGMDTDFALCRKKANSTKKDKHRIEII